MNKAIIILLCILWHTHISFAMEQNLKAISVNLEAISVNIDDETLSKHNDFQSFLESLLEEKQKESNDTNPKSLSLNITNSVKIDQKKRKKNNDQLTPKTTKKKTIQKKQKIYICVKYILRLRL